MHFFEQLIRSVRKKDPEARAAAVVVEEVIPAIERVLQELLGAPCVVVIDSPSRASAAIRWRRWADVVMHSVRNKDRFAIPDHVRLAALRRALEELHAVTSQLQESIDALEGVQTSDE